MGTRSDVVDTAASGTVVTGCDHHLDPSSSLSFNRSLQLVADCTTFRDRATPGVNRYVGCLRWIALIRRAVKRVRCKEEFHALDVSGWCAIALVHVTATDPFCAGRHANLITRAIIPDRSAGGVCSVEEIIARLLRIIATRVANAVVNGIVPVVIMVRVHPVPTAVVGLQRIMCPALASVGAGHNNVLPGEPSAQTCGA